MNNSKPAKSIYDQHKEDRQNHRLAQDLNNHNWLVNKIITNQLKSGPKKSIQKELDLKENMKTAIKFSKGPATSGATKRSLQDHSDATQAKLQKKVSDRSLPDLGETIAIISDVKDIPNRRNAVSSFPLLKKILNNEDINSKSALILNLSSDKYKTPVDQRQEGGTSGTQSSEHPVAGPSSKSTGPQASEELFRPETPKLIRHNLPVPALPERKTYQQRSAELATSDRDKERSLVPGNRETDNILDFTLNMDYKGIIECLIANNIKTVPQLTELIECHRQRTITEEESKILEFLQNKEISTLENLVRHFRLEDDIIFVNEEILPDGKKVVPISQKKVKALLAQSEQNKMVLGNMTKREWCRFLMMQANADIIANRTDEPSCLTHLEKSSTETEEKGDTSSNVEEEVPKSQENIELETEPVATTQPMIQTDQPAMDANVGTATMSDACVQTLESRFESSPGVSPGPSLGLCSHPDEAAAIASSHQALPLNTSNHPNTASHAMPQRAASMRGRKRSYTPRDPRSRAKRQEQQSDHNAQNNLRAALHHKKQAVHNNQFVQYNAALQSLTSQPTATHAPVLPHNSHQLPRNTPMLPQNFQVRPPNIRQLSSPYAAQMPPHSSQLGPHLAQHAQLAQKAQHTQQTQHAQNMSRTPHPQPHNYYEAHANRRPNPGAYGQNCYNQSHSPMGQNMVHGTNNQMAHPAYNGQSDPSNSYQQWPLHQNISGQHWQEPMINNQAIHTTYNQTTVTNYTMTYTGMNIRTITNTTVANHTIVNPTMSMSAMANSAMAESTISAGQHQRRSTMGMATAMQWMTPEVANMGGGEFQAHANAASQYRASMSNTRGQHPVAASAFAGGNEPQRQFVNAPADRLSPQIGAIMPEWLWHSRRWPQM